MNLPEIIQSFKGLAHKPLSDAEYWCNENLALTKGYELSSALQNILDDINCPFADQFTNQNVDVSTLTQEQFEVLIKAIDLSPLGRFVNHKGVDHHYHVEAGLGSKQFKLELDLKCIPTVLNNHASVVASIGFISAKLIVGDRVFQDLCIQYIGPQELESQHLEILTNGKYASNQYLGAWLKFVRSLSYEEHVNLIETQKTA